MNVKTFRLDLMRCNKIPEGELRQDYFYYCEKSHTAVHLCACGCGSRVVTPIAYEGQPSGRNAFRLHATIDNLATLDRPIVNVHLPCYSRYYIRSSRIEWL